LRQKLGFEVWTKYGGVVLYFYEEPPVSVLKNKLELSQFRFQFHTETKSRIGF
jgi:hypothetical protein